MPLVEREGRGLRLTTAGRTFAGYARTILGLHEEALAAARGDLDPERGRVRVAAVTTAGEHVLPASLAAFLRRHPGVDLRLEVGTSEHVWALLDAHEADLVIAGRPPPGLDGGGRARRAPKRAGRRRRARRGDGSTGRATWLMREAGSGTRATCEALLAAWRPTRRRSSWAPTARWWPAPWPGSALRWSPVTRSRPAGRRGPRPAGSPRHAAAAPVACRHPPGLPGGYQPCWSAPAAGRGRLGGPRWHRP